MSLIEKALDLLLSKNWIHTLIAFIAAFLAQIFISDEYFKALYKKLPFEQNTKVIIVFVFLFLVFFLIIHFIVYIIKKFTNYKEKTNHLKVVNERKKIKSEENIELFQSFADKWSDEDYKIVVQLINNKNQTPYITRFIKLDSMLNNSNIFVSTTETVYEKAVDTENKYIGDVKTIRHKVLLKEDFYKLCQIVLQEKGRLSHFDRKIDGEIL